MSDHANRTYKDSVFSKYFRENKEGLVELFNAIEGTSYPLDTPVVVETLEDVLYKEKINDLSFRLNEQILVLIEHQSTINENMALRLLMYVARLYEKLLNQWEKRVMYEERRILIPTPKFVVLYNSKAPYPEHSEQYLSQSFLVKEDYPALELKVDVYNINYGENNKLLQKSKHLNDYSLFIHAINQEYTAGKPLTDAIKEAISYCIEHDIMGKFLQKNGSEVRNMLIGEWKTEEAMEYIEEKAKKEGEKLGRTEEREKLIRAFSDLLTPEQIAEKLQLPVESILAILQNATVVAEPEVSYEAKKTE